jgi:hypothetical protein
VAARLVERDGRFRFRMLGPDTPADPFGRSYRAHLDARMPAPVRERLRFEALPARHDRPRVLAPFSLCLFPARWMDAPYALLEAMRLRAAVLVSRPGGPAGLVADGESGLLVDLDDPTGADGAADAVLRLHAEPATVERMGNRARAAVEQACSPGTVARLLASAYRDSPGRRPARAAGGADGPAGPARARPPRVSVVIPVFDRTRYLAETIGSVRASHYDDVEIVVVDDGSTDPRAARDLRALDGVVRVTHERNRGVATARNSGIAASSGRFVMPLDADDLVEPTYLPKAVAALTRVPALAYVGCYSQNFGLLDTTYVPVGYVPDLMLYLHTDGRCTKLFRREAFDSVGGYDEDLPAFEDWDLYLSLAERGGVGDVIPEPLFLYRRHLDSTVFTWSNDMRIELLQFLVRKHRRLLADRHETVVLNLLHLWKTYFEVSESVILQQGGRSGHGEDLAP